MAADVEAIVEELGLPDFRVPAPRNSAQHRSAALHHSRMAERRHGAQPLPPQSRAPDAAPVHHPTRQFTREPGDWPDSAPETEAEPEADEYGPDSGQFAGIPIDEFVWVRQHNRRMVLIWVAVVLALTGLVATAAWTIGVHLSGLL
jgi:serine/threonine-protein kinase